MISICSQYEVQMIKILLL